MVKKCSNRCNAIDEVFRNKTQSLDGIFATLEYWDSIFYSIKKFSGIETDFCTINNSKNLILFRMSGKPIRDLAIYLSKFTFAIY